MKPFLKELAENIYARYPKAGRGYNSISKQRLGLISENIWGTFSETHFRANTSYH